MVLCVLLSVGDLRLVAFLVLLGHGLLICGWCGGLGGFVCCLDFVWLGVAFCWFFCLLLVGVMVACVCWGLVLLWVFV